MLRYGGRMIVSAIVVLQELPESIRSFPKAYVGRIAAAMLKHEYLSAIAAAGFASVSVLADSRYASGVCSKIISVRRMEASARFGSSLKIS